MGRIPIERDHRVLITGATSGIGRELARQLGARGCRIAITGRREAKLDACANEVRKAGGEALPLVGTVTDPDIVRGHYDAIQKSWQGIDVAILNAGVGDSCHARQFTAENYRWTFDVNVFGICNWIEMLLPGMLENAKEGKRPVIAGISSPAGWRGFPEMGSYSSSKAAVTTMLESIRVDLRGTAIDIITVCHGWVKSEITDRNDPKDMFVLLETDDGARRIINGIEQRKRLVHFPRRVTWLVRAVVRPLPGWAFDRLMARVARRTPKKPYVDESAQK